MNIRPGNIQVPWALLLLALGCSDPPPSQMAQDASVPLERAVKACGTLTDVRQRGRCTLDALKARDAISMEDCTNIPGKGLRGKGLGVDGKLLIDRGLGLGTEWHDECLYEAAGQSTKPLVERYRMCQQSGSFARVCGYQLWHRALNELQVGAPGTDEEVMAKANSIFIEHKVHAQRLDHTFTQTYWTWFWGNWWSQQGTTGDASSTCAKWKEAADRKACEAWSDEAQTWLQNRELNRPG